MKTTLKRGVGRGHEINGNGKIVRRARRTITVYRQPEPPKRSRRSLALAILGWTLTVIVVCVTGVAEAHTCGCTRRWQIRPEEYRVKATAKKLDLPVAGQPATALVIGYDPRRTRRRPRRHAPTR